MTRERGGNTIDKTLDLCTHYDIVNKGEHHSWRIVVWKIY